MTSTLLRRDLVKIVTTAYVLIATFVCPNAVWADNKVDSLMRAEADTFLAHLPSELQHRQAIAIREAIGGDCRSLQLVRQSRNSSQLIDEKVRVRMLTPTLRLYEPKGTETEKLPLLIYLHGGGWTFGSLNSCGRYCNAMAARGGIRILAVDYRLAPEHPFPTGVNDCINAVEYCLSHADELNIIPSQISIGGDSSGGNLALAVSLSEQCKRKIYSLVLFYPVTKAFNDGSDSWQEYGTGYGLDAELMDAFNQAYSIKADPKVEQISIGICTEDKLTNLPPTLLIAAGRDILRDQGEELTKKSKGRINRVEFKEAAHLFITVPGQDTAFNAAVDLSHRFLTAE